jgi:signal transduction histidine kinase/integral membrane sensor domain MASE1
MKTKSVFTFIAIAFSYFLAVRLGIQLTSVTQASPVWPATGIGIALLLRFGRGFWPAISLGALIANTMTGGSLITIIGITFTNTIEALLAAWIIFRYRSKKDFFPVYASTISILVAVVVAAAISATLGFIFLYLGGAVSSELFSTVWLTWWTGDLTGGIILAPVILEFGKERDDKHKKVFRLFFVFVSGVFLSWALLIRPEGFPHLFLLFPYLLACLWLSGVGAMYFSILLISIVSTWTTIENFGVFRHASTNSNLLNLQIFLIGMGITSLVLRDINRLGKQALRLSSIILLVGWGFSAGFFYILYSQSIQKINLQLTGIANNIEPEINAQTNLYAVALKGIEGLFSASNVVEKDEWISFVKRIDFKKNFPGLQALMTSFYVPRGQLENFVAKQKKEGRSEFKVALFNNLEHSKDHFIVTYVEPLKGNERILGLDFSGEPVRRNAAELAMDTGQVTISNKTSLIQDIKQRSAFVMFKAFYKNGAIPQTIEQRRDSIVGWIHAAIISEKFFGSVLKRSIFKDISYSISQDGVPGIILESKDYQRQSAFSEQVVKIKIANQKFTIHYRPSKSFISDVDTISSWFATGGVILTLLLSLLIVAHDSVKLKAIRLAEEKYLDIQNQLKATLDSIPDLLIELDTKMICHTLHIPPHYPIQPTFSEIYLGKNISEFLPNEVFLVFEEVLQEAKMLGFSKGKQYKIIQDNLAFWFELSVLLKSKEAQRFIFLSRDITDRKDNEIKLSQSSKMASLGEMAGAMGHEINNPLAIIVGKSEKIKRQLDSSKDQALVAEIDKIKDTALRIANIIKGLRNFSRNADADPFVKTNLKEVVEDTLSLCRERFKNTSVELRSELISDVTCECRSAQISQVILNLLNNAYDAVQDLSEKWVQIDLTSPNSTSVQIRVTDSGDGIPREVARKLMEPFFTTKEVGKGVGLGLSISYALIKDHGGNLMLDETSKKTSFVINLPSKQS